jgi:multicomponent Na+:H+ antiporter subunit B
MTRRTRVVLFAPVGVALLVILLTGVGGLPQVGQGRSAYGEFVAGHMVADRGTTDVVAPLTFDLRAFDTLGEEFVLFAAAAACALLLRGLRKPDEIDDEEQDQQMPALATPPLQGLTRLLVAPTIVLAAYVVSHGQVTPGGGFQGGVILAMVGLLLLSGGRIAVTRRALPVTGTEAVEAAGAGAFALLGIGGLVFAAAAFENFLGAGKAGDLLSGGTIPLANVAVGIEVAAGFVLIFVELFQQEPRGGGR